MPRYERMKKDVFIRNREKVKQHLKPGSVAVFNSNDIMPTNADGTMPFRQNNDLFYLSGADQEESILVLAPDTSKKGHQEMLFVKKTSKEIAIWEGEKLTKDKATEVSGIETVYWLQDFEKVFKTIVMEAAHIYLNSNEHLRNASEVETRDDRFRDWCMATYPMHKFERIAPILHRVRSIKEPEEIEMMQKACNITEKAFRRILKFVKPGVKEYEIQAEMMYEFFRNGSRGPAYDPIIASGFNACVLHYIENADLCNEGEVILMDFGAEYGNYASDLSRSIPVSGKFTQRQKDVYNAVLHVQRESMKLLVPGIYLDEYHKQVGELMAEQLVKLDLLTMDEVKNQDNDSPAYKKFFMHGTSHFIGLDVHDVGIWHEPLKENMAFTVEPGIYIREENLGIRLENDVIIKKDGIHDLMGNIPIEAEEVEELMNC